MHFSIRSVKSIFSPVSGSTSINLYPSPSITPSDATVVDVNPVAERYSLSQGFGTISFQAKPPKTRREPSFTYVTIPSIPGTLSLTANDQPPSKQKEPPDELLSRRGRPPKGQETTSEFRVCAVHVGSASRESNRGAGHKKFNRSREPPYRGKECWRGVADTRRDKERQNGSSRWQAEASGTHQKVDA
ncbi:hypothetical protein K443DRAFT_124405 [Laccaria amethystina LaAM-08-1]|uniref:Uncharacterized protein n=1 Tax=Laccaria amethystina LaAM-08-1 TaxID=1095629 RepID=A0A0C9WVM5_9AGAR|nr:hypothetical protein K443DRAFT_124405 [Laccaria amethystina LaAM-08-1]